MHHVRSIAALAAAMTGSAVAAEDVAFRLGLAGPARDRVIAVMDLSGAPKNAIVRTATFTATITDGEGKRHRLTRDMLAGTAVVAGGQQRRVSFAHQVLDARRIESSGLRWSTRAAGEKTDSADGQTAPAMIVDFPSAGGIIPPPPSVGVSCDAYGDNAVRQQTANKTRGCGFVSTRWSADRAYHVRWCRSAGPAAANAETRIRTQMLAKCNVE